MTGSRRARLAAALVFAAWLGGACADPAPQALGRAARAQVIVTWGGGAPRAWSGELRVVAPRDADAPPEIPWTWLHDWEEGDHALVGEGFAAPEQRLPTGWRASRPEELADPSTPPPLGARFETRTEGEADGFVFELRADLGTRLRFEAKGGAVLDVSLAELLAAPVVHPLGGEGQHLVARAIDLARETPPRADHFGRPTRRLSLHTHSCFSTNETALEPVAASLRPFVDDAWWTDHVPAEERLIVAGDFEDAAAVARFWRASAVGCELGSARRIQEARRGKGAFELRVARRAPPRDGETSGAQATVALGEGAGWLHLALDAQPVLRWSWRELGDGVVPYVEAQLNAGRRVRWLGGAPPAGHALDPERDLVLEAPGEGWRDVERSVAVDAGSLAPDAPHDGLLHVTFGLLLADGSSGGSSHFDELALEAAGAPGPAERLALQRRLLESIPGPRVRLGYEQSSWYAPNDYGGLLPHLTALLPRAEEGPWTQWDAAPSAAQRRERVRVVQAAGGGVGAHHLRLENHYEALLDGGGLGVDWIEFGGGRQEAPHYATRAERAARDANGYAARSEDELEPLLVRWDRMTARGLFVTGCGAPDLHRTFERPSYGTLNRWLTSVIGAPGEALDEAGQLAALRAGRVSSAEWFSDAVVSLALDGDDATGTVWATDREAHRLTARVSGALPGSRLRWIHGELVVGVAGDAERARERPVPTTTLVGVVTVPEASVELTLDVEVARAGFWRAELLDPSGHLVALGNPVVLLPYWPDPWPGARGRVDWGGVRWVPGADDPGDEPPSADPAAPRADPRALPSRKALLAGYDVGTPAVDAALELAGFGRGYDGALPLHYRRVGAAPASFTLELPPGERLWLELHRLGFSATPGRLSMDGEVLGRFERMEAMVFELDPARLATPDGAPARHRFTLELELEPGARLGFHAGLSLTRIEVRRGPGVVDY